MAPALVAVGTDALLLAWNEYLDQSCSVERLKHDGCGGARTNPENSDVAPWNADAWRPPHYAIPPIATDPTFRRRMSSPGSDDGWRQGVKGRKGTNRKHKKLSSASWNYLVLVPIDVARSPARSRCVVVAGRIGKRCLDFLFIAARLRLAANRCGGAGAAAAAGLSLPWS